MTFESQSNGYHTAHGNQPLRNEPLPVPSSVEVVRVFVLLGYGFGEESWRRRFERGLIPGLNEKLPYGYHHAAGDGWSIRYSQDKAESPIARYCRRVLTGVLGFDLLHVWRNRRSLFDCDVVWTHTEREHLGALLLFSLCGSSKHPKIIAQCVWLFDRWRSFSSAKRALYRYLLKQADVVTTQSPEDLKAAREVLPGILTECILSGATVEKMLAPRIADVHRPMRLAALGNDMHRDWKTLLRAFGGMNSFELRIASEKVSARLLRGVANVSICSATTDQEIRALFEWADIVVVSLKANLHASGITVIFEAVVSGVPVVATDTGGLRAYFSDEEICYVPVGDPTAMRCAAERLAGGDGWRHEMALNAQRRIRAANFTKQGYADRHRHLTQRLLNLSAGESGKNARELRPLFASRPDPVKVFVLLGPGFGFDSWCDRYRRGLIPGLNEALPYGYHRAGSKGWSIEYSQDLHENWAIEIGRRALAKVLGFDLLHTWRNRKRLFHADIVWTHTEREHLAALLLCRWPGVWKRPKIIAQSIWIFDRWSQLSRPRRELYRFLLMKADKITTLSPENLHRAKQLLPQTPSELVVFGSGPSMPGSSPRATVHSPLRLLAIGNDMHRDWPTLVLAFGGVQGVDLKIVSSKVPRRLVEYASNVSAASARTENEVKLLYEWADIVVVPLKPNLHASGISVILEAILSGVAVAATDTGGLREYFSDQEICYVPVGDAEAMRTAVTRFAKDNATRVNMIARAQWRRISAGLTAEAYAIRHRRLSEELLGVTEVSDQVEPVGQMLT